MNYKIHRFCVDTVSGFTANQVQFYGDWAILLGGDISCDKDGQAAK